MQIVAGIIKLEGVWARVKSCGIWPAVRQRLVVVAGKVKSILRVALSVDRAAYIQRINAERVKEEARGTVLLEILKAKKSLQEAKDNNVKLKANIKKVGHRN